MPAFDSLPRATIMLAVGLMAIIVMMVLPMPAWVLDVGLSASFASAILIFTVTLFIERPLDFSAFPTLLLASLMLRLALNVSSTKLIIGNGHTGTHAAGEVIEGFAAFVMGGNLLIGLVVFCVIMIVNFIVITKGAGRMAEVSARFALDAMPGKQLAIDSDMNAGAIDHAEARTRREREQAETTFFGSLDGVSKFVKGDAVAGLMITGLNFVMGLIVGTVMHGMPIGQALETYAILTVGDGLVSQIPAVIISVAAALLLARGGAKGSTDKDLFAQLGKHPAALATVAVLMALFALVPGLPFTPFMLGAVALGLAAWRMRQKPGAPDTDTPASDAPPPKPRSMGDTLDLDELHVEFAPDLVSMVLDPATGLDARIGNMRNHVAVQFGLILPEIRLTDDPALPSGGYRIRIQGVEVAQDRVQADRVLALCGETRAQLPPGEDVDEPVYRAPARWIAPDATEEAAMLGATVVGPAEVLATHLLEVVKTNLGRLFSLRGLRRLLDEQINMSDPARTEANRRMLDEMIPDKVPMDALHAVLKLLLEERVSIRNLPLILEAMAEARGIGGPEATAEHVRQRMGFQIVAGLKRADGSLPLIQLAPEWEEIFTTYQIDGDRGQTDVALPPERFNRLSQSVSERLAQAMANDTQPALITSARRRRCLRTMLAAKGIAMPVLSYEEIGFEARPALVGTVAA
ncbi:flagellar biosynthesis protein FlhA [Paracoccus sp. p3-h83]|uniref:flagellar biosynthesis protein FlhA n=1 Tax=Paracoccus sp. p3-h83 TaxID=3342805 RepID=UPI0035BA9116